MKKYLLDTHTLLWTLFEPGKLSKRVRVLLEDPSQEAFISAISFWEISLKFGLGKLRLKGAAPEQLPALAVKSGFEILSLDEKLLSSYHKLHAGNHRDPFDRMIVWQCLQQNFILLSKDDRLGEHKKAGLIAFW